MKTTIETVRLSQKARDQLIAVKRYTGIQNWNTLSRWAFCISLAESTPPSQTQVVADSNVEMTWKVFGGAYHELYFALLVQRCVDDGLEIDQETLAVQFRAHLHRGIGYLAESADFKSIALMLASITK